MTRSSVLESAPDDDLAAHAAQREAARDRDYVACLLGQAKALRQGALDPASLALIAEELEELSKSEKRRLRSQLIRLFAHLIKWDARPTGRSRIWALTIRGARREIAERLAESPSLKNQIAALTPSAFDVARDLAAIETGLPIRELPRAPYAFDEAMSRPADWPEE